MRQLLTPQKRSNEGSEVWILRERTWDFDGVKERNYKLKILLPNGMAVLVKIPEGEESVTVRELANIAKQQCERETQAEQTINPKQDVRWDADFRIIDDGDFIYETFFNLKRLRMTLIYNLRLDDGSQPETIYKNMWKINCDTELLTKLPEEYTFEIALADLIDKSLKAVWPNDEYDPRLISVEVSNDKLSICDTGPGMDFMSIEKWGETATSYNWAYETQADMCDKPPYLNPIFSMFGYGGFTASMHLGRRIEVSLKTKISHKVYMLGFERDALTNTSISSSKGPWRTYGGLREATNEELALFPMGSFTKVEIFEPNMRCTNIRQLQCKLKDIYYPYIKGAEIPLKFQVNGDDLAKVRGGEVAITNQAACTVPEFILQIRFKLNHTMESSQGSSEEANARLRFVYLPVQKGKESIEMVLDALKEDGYEYPEEIESFRHVSCRWLGRLLPGACWEWLPFMDLRQRNTGRSQVLKKCCMRVKCYIDTDAGFSPTPSKTDFLPQNPFTSALMNLGSKQPLENDSGIEIDIRKDGRSLSLTQLDKKYELWLRNMHRRHDDDGKTPIIKERQIEKRQLRISSEMPERCFAGSQLENLVFEIADSNGDVDVNYHNDDKIGQSHTLEIRSQFKDIDEVVKYVFREGRCIVRAVPLPSEEGEFTFVAVHSRCPELQLTLKVMIELPLKLAEPINMSHNLNAISVITPKTVDTCPATDRQQETNFYQIHEDLSNEIHEIGLRIGKLEREIKTLEDEQNTMEVKLSQCEGIGGNGAVSLGCSKFDIVSLVVPPRNQLSQDVTRVLNHDVELKLKLDATISKLDEKRKSHASLLKSFNNRLDMYLNHITQLPQVDFNSTLCNIMHPRKSLNETFMHIESLLAYFETF